MSDKALVVYRGIRLIGVKHHEVSPWLLWDSEHICWEKAPSSDAKDFEHLPLAGHVDN